MSSLEKALLLLKRLGEPPYELGLSEIAVHAGIGKSGAYKLLRTMQEQNFVIQDHSSKKYHLSPIMLRLGNVYGHFKGIGETAPPILAHTSRAVGETTYITIWEGDRAFPAYKHRVPGGVYDVNDFIGKSIPLNSGGSAMLLCAYQDPEHIRSLLDASELERRTPYTLVDRDVLMEEYRKIRDQGYALEDEVFNIGVLSLAVPVFDRERAVRISLAMAPPKKHATEGKIVEWLHLLKDGAEELSYKLQFRR